jgi:drug/metabolite transporter (DMT)-like permease
MNPSPTHSKSNQAIAGALVLAVVLWGGNNAGVKYLVTAWPPIFVGGTRFVCAGLIMLAVLRWTRWLGVPPHPAPAERRALWWRGGLSLAIYIVVFNWALHFTSASHVALYLGASPVWALLMDGKPAWTWQTLRRYASAALALTGVIILFLPTLQLAPGNGFGELLALASGVLWAFHGRQIHRLSSTMSSIAVTAHTMWRAGLMLLPLALIEVVWLKSANHPLVWRWDLFWVQGYCILAGGVAAFCLWNSAFKYWPTSQVYLFSNLIPISTMTWAHFCLGEQVSRTYFYAMILVVGAVILAQVNWAKLAPAPEE